MKKKKMMKKMLSVSQKGETLDSICIALKMTRDQFKDEIKKSKDLCRCFAMSVTHYGAYWEKQLICMMLMGKMYVDGVYRTADTKMFKDLYENEVLKNISNWKKIIAEAERFND